MKKVYWLTGLSGAGKTTIAKQVKKEYSGIIILDGDDLRLGINKDLGFTNNDRKENIRRVAEIAKLFILNNRNVIVSFISPTKEIRDLAKEIIGLENFIEIYVNAPIELCERRDVKGLYKKVRAGKIKDFTGIDSPYEAPEDPDLELRTDILSIEDSAEEILDLIIDIS